jgi:hypothetical protein
MSNPKEKAKELFDKYKPICAGYNGGQSNKYFTKQAALIAVDEVLNQFIWKPSTGMSYWQEVKTEINNL